MNDEDEILRIHDEWIRLEESGNEKEVLRFCSQDVVWLVPGLGVLRGIEGVRSFLNEQPDATIVSIDAFDVEVEVSGKLAVKRANFCTRFVDDGAEKSAKGTHIWTLRKDRKTEQWRVTSLTWVITPDN